MAETLRGRVLKCIRGHFWVEAADGVYHCLARDRVNQNVRQTTPITVGDDVKLEVLSAEEAEGLIVEVLPRQTKLSRRIQTGLSHSGGVEDVVAANIDQVVIVASVKRPRLRRGLIDRYLVAAGKGGLESLICLNKIDLAAPGDVEPVVNIYRNLGYPVVLTSALTGQGMDELRCRLRDKKSVFAGHSGVGKSTLLRQLCPGLEVKTAGVNPKTGRGKHTTTTAQLVHLPSGGYVIDTPGIRQFALWDLTAEDIQHYFREIAQHAAACRFRDCSHTVEPGCTVRQALEREQIHPHRYESFLKLRQECKTRVGQ